MNGTNNDASEQENEQISTPPLPSSGRGSRGGRGGARGARKAQTGSRARSKQPNDIV